MTPQDLSVLAQGLAAETKTFVAAAIARAVDQVRETYGARVEQLEARVAALQAAEPVAGRDGKDGAPGLDGKDGAAGKDGAPGLDGKDGAPGRDGTNGLDGMHGKDGAPGRDGKDGGAGINGKDGAPGQDGKAGAAGLNGKDGRDGIGLTGALISRQGTVVMTFSDGQTKDIGPVIADPALVAQLVAEQLATWPRPQDGAPGAPGRDGTLEDLQIDYDGKRTVTFSRKDGSLLRELVLPIPLDEGVWQPSDRYSKGACVTWGGSVWIAQKDAPLKPGTTDSGWRLAVKRGTDGKDGRDGKDAE